MCQDFRIIACVCCCGDRGHFDDGNDHWITCRACNGEGEIEIEPEMLSIEDLEFGPNYTRHTPVQGAEPLTSQARHAREAVGRTGSSNLPTGASSSHLLAQSNKPTGRQL